MKNRKLIILWYALSALAVSALHFHEACYWSNRTNETALTFPLAIAFSFIIFVMVLGTGIVIFSLDKTSEGYHDRSQKRRFILELVCSILLSGVFTFLYFLTFSPVVQSTSNSGLAVSFAISLSFLLYTFLICINIILYHIRKK